MLDQVSKKVRRPPPLFIFLFLPPVLGTKTRNGGCGGGAGGGASGTCDFLENEGVGRIFELVRVSGAAVVSCRMWRLSLAFSSLAAFSASCSVLKSSCREFS